jgi:hypothetical protein
MRELEKELEYYDEREIYSTGNLLTHATAAQFELKKQKV